MPLGDIVVLDDEPAADWQDELSVADLATLDAIEQAYKVGCCLTTIGWSPLQFHATR